MAYPPQRHLACRAAATRIVRLSGLCVALLLWAVNGFGQVDSTPVQNGANQLDPAVITGIQPTSPRLTSLHIEPYSLADLERKSPYNLSDALAKLPGISQLTTGNAISKPVIRGLFGNRILVLLSGLRFDNQQFQDEHGLGLSQIGIDRVEIIRGPASILYGTDAIGGVINVIEEKPSVGTKGTTVDVGTRLYSGTLGTLTDIGLAHRFRKSQQWLRARAGIESHGDYADAHGNRVFDSRNTGYYFKAGYGFSRPHLEMDNSYNLSFNQFGFVLDSILGNVVQDGRWSRSMQNPHHNVLLNAFSSQNTFYIHRTSTPVDGTTGALLKVNAGFQSNKRAEDEGGGSISLNMHLLSLLESARLEKYLSNRVLFIANQQTTFENNTNYGKRILIPDANMLENTLSGFLRYIHPTYVLEGGAGITYKNIRTFQTGILNAPGKAVAPFSVLRTDYNILAGVSYNPTAHLNIKTNISTGLRSANLAELSSNGLHEGTLRYEIGDPNLRLEHVISGDLTLEAFNKNWFVSASIYGNRFNNYIYLAQTSDTVLGIFPIFRYRQQNASLWGGEFTARYRITSYLWAKDVFSFTRGETTDGNNLPFISPPRNLFSLQYVHNSHKMREITIEPEAEYVGKYNRLGPFETENPTYLLLNLHANAERHINGHIYKFGLSFRNLLNSYYTDPLSRLRYYGIYNQGINIVASIRVTL